jgi:biopolymer transport protein ExbB
MNVAFRYFEQLRSYLDTGGIVMVPLLVVSLLMWVLIINRAFFFRRLYRRNMSREKAGQFVQLGKTPSFRRYRGITAMFVSEFILRRSGKRAQDRRALDETVMILSLSLDRYLGLIGVLARVAPLLGLLGTILGMMRTFNIISLFGTGNPKAMAAGISEALITTQTGLLVAIPGLYMYGFLARRADNLKHRLASLGIYLKRYV